METVHVIVVASGPSSGVSTGTPGGLGPDKEHLFSEISEVDQNSHTLHLSPEMFQTASSGLVVNRTYDLRFNGTRGTQNS